MTVNLNGRNTLALVVLIAALWAMTDCGGQRICRLRGGAVVHHETATPDNWQCRP